MKKHKSSNKILNTSILAGAAATFAMTANCHAQSSVNDLLNTLEQKGILTAAEAQALKKENEADASKYFDNALNQKFPMAPWVKNVKFSGDFRGRYDFIGSDYSNDRGRLRYRIRAGFVAKLDDNFQVGFRLGSGDYPGSHGGDPLSNNTTLQDNFSKKSVYIDEAYAMWTPINDGTWLLAATIGKMGNPFHFTPMVFDPDLTPEGGALTGKYTINDKNNITFAGAGLVLDEISSSTHDPFLYGGQVAWNAKWTDQLASTLGIGGFQIVSPEQLTSSNVQNYNQGNTLDANGAPLYNFNPVIADASMTYTLNRFPLYKGKFPIKLAGEFINNPGAPNNNNGYWVGVTFGKAGKKHSWDVSYRYEYLESDAWYAQLVNDDNVAYVPASPTTGGIGGGTNIKGHLIKADYSLTDSLTLSFTCYLNELINNPYPAVNSSAIHAMADVMWKF